MRRWAPIAEHRNCARHIYANWKKHFSVKEWQKLFWRCAKAPCLLLFNKARARLARDTIDGAQAIMNTHPEHWSRAWFRLGSMCDSVDNNLCESFNKWIVEARLFPIITMLEIIRRKVMVRIHEQKKKAERWMTKICPAILKKCNTYITLSGRCHAICNGESKFEVIYYDNRFTVDLDRKQCSCRYWQLSGLPCHHAISCIFFKTSSLEDYIASCYSTEAFNRTYDYCLNPLEGMNGWPASDSPPLRLLVMLGCQEGQRRRGEGIPQKVQRAQRCLRWARSLGVQNASRLVTTDQHVRRDLLHPLKVVLIKFLPKAVHLTQKLVLKQLPLTRLVLLKHLQLS